jgi:hypothetical protein
MLFKVSYVHGDMPTPFADPTDSPETIDCFRCFVFPQLTQILCWLICLRLRMQAGGENILRPVIFPFLISSIFFDYSCMDS